MRSDAASHECLTNFWAGVRMDAPVVIMSRVSCMLIHEPRDINGR
jgi:hypothetical protein